MICRIVSALRFNMWLRASFLVVLAFIALRVKRWEYSDIPLSLNAPVGLEYDYIIVGGGTAGCVVANRLTEDPEISVLLLEAGGPDDHPYISVPAFYNKLRESYLDWSYRTSPHENACMSFENLASWWPVGKTLGGTSSINGLIYARGNKEDYNSWERGGAKGWSYEAVLPYFQKAETCLFAEGDKRYHGFSGPIPISKSDFMSDPAQLFLAAGEEMGYKEVDYNGESQVGFSQSQLTVGSGVRYSAAKAYLHPARWRKNLFIKTNVRVRNILFNEEKRAFGVQVFDNEVLQANPYRAKREVVLSAGTIESAHLLMVSGVGPSELLEPAGVPVVKELPGVGKNLQDHVMVPMEYWVDAEVADKMQLLTEEALSSTWSSLEYLLLGRGPRAASTLEAVAFVNFDKTNVSNPTSKPSSVPIPTSTAIPDIQLHFSGGIISLDNYKNAGFNSQAVNQMFGYEPFSDSIIRGYVIFPSLLHPKSRGEIVFDWEGPFMPPAIKASYLSDENDVKDLLKGIRFVQKLVNTSALGKIGGFLSAKNAKCSYKFDTDKFWEWYIRHATWSLSHYAGTCKMGSVEDEMAVVDPRLRVIGLDGLRVVDASVLPTLPSGNTQAAVVMVAERAADFIKEDRKP